MQYHQHLLSAYGGRKTLPDGREPVHISLAAWPDRIGSLAQAVGSLLDQADTLNVFLNRFDHVPVFLDHEKIFLTRSEDFGDLGECGKYYWCDDLRGFMVFCSDHLRYPGNFIKILKERSALCQNKSIVAAGGYRIHEPFRNYSSSLEFFSECSDVEEGMELPVLSDHALAFYSSALHLSRHHFYQPELSHFWLAISAREQQVPMNLIPHPERWIQETGTPAMYAGQSQEKNNICEQLIRAWFVPQVAEKQPASLNEMFDRIYVMNLDRRPDRWKKVQDQARYHRISLSRFPAVDGTGEAVKRQWERYFSQPLQALPEGIEPLHTFTDKFTRYHHYVARIQFMEEKFRRKAVQSAGAFGYALTYIAILEEAIRNGYQRIMIFDDDVLLHHDFNKAFAEGITRLPAGWYLIMLGAMQHNWDPWISWENETFYRCHGSSVASHAVGIDRKVFLPLLWYARRLDLPIDEGAVFHIQNVYKERCFIWYPNLAIQDMMESDISTSAMKEAETERWLKLFRWEPDLYKIPEVISLHQKVINFVKLLKRKIRSNHLKTQEK